MQASQADRLRRCAPAPRHARARCFFPFRAPNSGCARSGHCIVGGGGTPAPLFILAAVHSAINATWRMTLSGEIPRNILASLTALVIGYLLAIESACRSGS